MKYRALAIGITVDGHPLQTMSALYEVVHQWAFMVIARHKCQVEIYRSAEGLIETVEPVEPPEKEVCGVKPRPSVPTVPAKI